MHTNPRHLCGAVSMIRDEYSYVAHKKRTVRAERNGRAVDSKRPHQLITRLLNALACLAPAAYAQNYPTKPIRLVLPFPPGGGTDALMRIIGPKLAENLGQTIVIDNRAGAAGNLSAEIVAHSQPDGY